MIPPPVSPRPPLFKKLSDCWLRFAIMGAGIASLVWFLVRVIPKPSRAGYPCQRAAFPVATSFVIWLAGTFAIKSISDRLRRAFSGHRFATVLGGFVTVGVITAWTLGSIASHGAAEEKKKIDWNFIPTTPNTPVGIARGIHPGRVVWTRDPLATKWAGNWQQKSDQWWLDKNTDQSRVDAMLSATILRLVGAPTNADAWKSIFKYYNQRARKLPNRGYQPGEVVAVKINMNNSGSPVKEDNYTDESPQIVLAMVRQLVRQAHVRPQDIIVYDGRRFMEPYILTKVWSEFKDVRFVQEPQPDPSKQPANPGYGSLHGLEASNWVPGIVYSNGKYNEAKLIPKQIRDATYLVNLAILKAHSYPYNTMEDGDEGQTAITMTGKNHFGSIKGTPELHPSIDTAQEAVKNAYSPIVDLASSPNLGAKTILFVLDGLYSGRKWRTYPVHFPNPPFNNRVEPYENSDWPASILASMDGVALDSVGLDIMLAQTKNNNDAQGRARLLIRANADDYLFEMAKADHPPSGTVYKQGGKVVTSLGVHERWDGDKTMRYSRNLNPAGKGIELIYFPMSAVQSTSIKTAPAAPLAPATLPGKGLAEHDFFYAGEGLQERMCIVRDGKIVWSYTHPAKGEISDAMRLPNGNVLFTHQFGVTEITPDKKISWNLDAPAGTEIHTAEAIGSDRVMFIQNGDPAKLRIVNKLTGVTEHEFALPVSRPVSVHGQFRHARMTGPNTVLVANMGLDKVTEYDLTGKELWSLDVHGPWSATPLENGNMLVISDSKVVREITRAGKTVWEFKNTDAPGYTLANFQLATRLPNGDTLLNVWHNQWDTALDPNNPPVQALKVTPDKKITWALRSWAPPADLGPATTIQLLDTEKTPAVSAR